jgi:hypothetical protein
MVVMDPYEILCRQRPTLPLRQRVRARTREGTSSAKTAAMASTGRLSGKAVFSTQLADPEGSQRFSASLSVRGPDTAMAPAPPEMRRM